MDYQLPELGEGVYEAEFGEWLVQAGDEVRHGQALAEVMTDKAVIELPSPFTGTIVELKAEPGETIQVGKPILSYTADAETEEVSGQEEEAKERGRQGEGEEPSHEDSSPASVAVSTSKPVFALAGPAVRRMARRLGVDLEHVRGTGPNGRILVDDLAAVLEKSPDGKPESRQVSAVDDYGTPGERIPFRGMRRKIAERMVQSKQTIPHYAYVEECDVTELVRLRHALREPFKQLNVHLTYLPFFVKAVVGALREVPLINSSLDEEAGEIVLHDAYHVGIAMHTPRGLIVPVLRNADTLSIQQLARRLEELAAAARAGQLRPEDLTGGTFTITSIGGIGGLISTPIINSPEAGILGIGRIAKRPIYDERGDIRPADMVYLSFSFDHRIVDGAVGAIFGNAVIQKLQNPARLLLTGDVS